MTRALARLEQKVGSTEPDWNFLYERQKNEADGTIGLALGERIEVVMRTRALTVMVTLLKKHTRGLIVKSMMGTK